MSIKKVLSLGILLVITAGVLNRDRAVSLDEATKQIAKLPTSQPNNMKSNQISTSDSSELTKIIASQTKFGLNLFQEVVKQNPEANTFISPLSVGVALSMLYNGADDTTQKELSSVLEAIDMSLEEVNQGNKLLTQELENSDSEVQIAIANSLWSKLNFSIEQSFLDINKNYYDTTIQELDFTSPDSVNIINSWVAENTENKITEIIDKISPDQALFLINAIYFKGQWQNKFNPEATKKQNFYLADGNVKQHPLMFNFGGYKYYENPNFQLVNLPYGSGSLSMNIFLPKKSSNLTEFLGLLNSEDLASWLQQMRLKEGKIQFPRFKQEYETNLNSILQQLGASTMFDPSQANFSNLSDDSVAIDEVKHKAVIEVNEEGTEAAATTSVGAVITSVTTPFNMTVDRPFFYTIQDNETGAIIFMGTVQNPEQ
ncbi:Serine protease inhibitor [Hyella patelloides LEGE 07179]|uniref:Serine protease inhibitor n=1 Tax=Hyella patelloides LEGE 07179 TaxID=945734 RepID=A0A563W2P2_9CYAN|nr:serpin family protein [Hyella patelloides]VEP17887.1 Serine protease inhibitor [Hyella patelloides LEGE 07179]